MKLWLPVSVTQYLRQVTIDNEPLVTGQLYDAAVLVTSGCGMSRSRIRAGEEGAGA